jgi:hypothetical protein
LESALGQLRLTQHGFERGSKRNIYPGWLHFSTAELFVLQKLNQTQERQIIEYPNGLVKILLPDLKAYVRDHEAIVTLVKRRRKVG